MSGNFRITGGQGAGNVGGAGMGGSPSTQPSPSRRKQPGQQPDGLQGSRVASSGASAPRGQIAGWQPRGGPGGPGSASELTAPALPRMERTETLRVPPRPETMPSLEFVQPHFTQQLVREGNITGTEHQGIAESDRRVSKVLQDRTPPILHRVVDQLDDAHSDEHISQNTYLQLANAAKRTNDRREAPAPEVNNTPEADAQGRFTGHGFF